MCIYVVTVGTVEGSFQPSSDTQIPAADLALAFRTLFQPLTQYSTQPHTSTFPRWLPLSPSLPSLNHWHCLLVAPRIHSRSNDTMPSEQCLQSDSDPRSTLIGTIPAGRALLRTRSNYLILLISYSSYTLGRRKF